ncbi:MAG: DUF4097 domain-containing protein [Acetobacter sp.]|nr:DUF4097 domain-containing protein [Bacteroides sp.]MCM1341285.1 DUF4097 domain-containing protein [Acetobacter sp.]MCM1433939.1 DUF4097 domain-containing protein [Clostridiales bacterium]
MKNNRKSTIAVISLLSIICILLIGIMISIMTKGGIIIAKNNDNNISIGEITTYDESFELGPNANISIDSDYGNIEIIESDSNKVRVVGESAELLPIEVNITGNTLNINRKEEVSIYFGGLKSFKGTITLYIPKNTAHNIKIETDYGDIISKSAINGFFDFETDYGHIVINEINGKFKLSTDCGNIEITNANITDNSSAKTDLGNIDITKTNPVRIDAESELGNNKINGSDSSSNIELNLHTDMGNITIN